MDRVVQLFSPDGRTPYLFLMSGLPGSGKTTIAKQLAERYRALVLSLDEFLVSLFGPSHIVDMPAERLTRVNAIRAPLWGIAQRALSMNISVVLDDGFFTAESRARALGACSPPEQGAIPIQPIIVYCQASLGILTERLAARSRRGVPFSHHISPELLASFSERFEPPNSEEGLEIVEVSTLSSHETVSPHPHEDPR